MVTYFFLEDKWLLCNSSTTQRSTEWEVSWSKASLLENWRWLPISFTPRWSQFTSSGIYNLLTWTVFWGSHKLVVFIDWKTCDLTGICIGQLHLRRVGVEAQPDLVRGISKDGTGGNPSEKNDGKEDADNPPKDDGGNSESPSTESQLPPPESSESQSIDDPPLSNSKGCLIGHGDTMLLLPCELLRNQQIMAAEILLQIALEIYVLYLVEKLYVISNSCWKFVQLL